MIIWKENQRKIRWNSLWILVLILIRITILIPFFRITPCPPPPPPLFLITNLGGGGRQHPQSGTSLGHHRHRIGLLIPP